MLAILLGIGEHPLTIKWTPEQDLTILNCHQNTESYDILGSQCANCNYVLSAQVRQSIIQSMRLAYSKSSEDNWLSLDPSSLAKLVCWSVYERRNAKNRNPLYLLKTPTKKGNFFVLFPYPLRARLSIFYCLTQPGWSL